MVSLEIPLDNVAIVLFNDHIFEQDCPTTEPNPNFPFEIDLTVSRSSDIGIDEFSKFVIELQDGVPYEFDVSHRYLDSTSDEFVPVDLVIDVSFDLPIEYDLTMYRSSIFGVNESWLVDSTKITYMAEYFKVNDTCIQVTMNRSIPLYLLHTIMVLLFIRYKTLSWIPCCLGIMLLAISI